MIYIFRPAAKEAAFAKQRPILKKAQKGVSSPKGSKTIKDFRIEQKLIAPYPKDEVRGFR